MINWFCISGLPITRLVLLFDDDGSGETSDDETNEEVPLNFTS